MITKTVGQGTRQAQHAGRAGLLVRPFDRFQMVLLAAGSIFLSACSGGGGLPFGGSDPNQLLFITAAQTWDLNKDNVVSCDEWKQYTSELFTLADGNKDGVVGSDEYARIVKADRLFGSAKLSFFDANGDGSLTAQEFTEKRNPAFDALDRNKDCQIASEEMVRTRGVAAAPPASGGGAAPGGSGPPRGS